jgi:predicted  nucleic acid-binding Zn-ribbon protein
MGGLGLDEMRDRITRLEKIVASVASTGGTGLDALVSLVDKLETRSASLEDFAEGALSRIAALEHNFAAAALRIQTLTAGQAGTMSAVEDRMLAQAGEIGERLEARSLAIAALIERTEALEKLTPWEREGISHGQWLENKRKEKAAKAMAAGK